MGAPCKCRACAHAMAGSSHLSLKWYHRSDGLLNASVRRRGRHRRGAGPRTAATRVFHMPLQDPQQVGKLVERDAQRVHAAQAREQRGEHAERDVE